MSMSADPLGYLFDIGSAFAPVDLNTANGATGHRVHLRNYEAVTFVFIKAAGTAGEDPDIDIVEHTAATGGTSADLDVVTEFYSKSETTLDGDETWTRSTQTAASEVELGDASAEVEGIYVVTVRAPQLSAGYEWVSANVAVTAAAAQLAAGIYIMTGLKIQRRPDLLAQPNA
jgi:hypothetical protein